MDDKKFYGFLIIILIVVILLNVINPTYFAGRGHCEYDYKERHYFWWGYCSDEEINQVIISYEENK